jgi:hypothetical protein
MVKKPGLGNATADGHERALLPRMVAASRHAKRPAQRTDVVLRLLRIDEQVARDLRARPN